MFYTLPPYTPDPNLPEDLARRPVAKPAAPPHCDANVVHAPGECRYCDDRPDRQALRLRQRIAFTGHPAPNGGRECPSDARRGRAGAHVWGGNRPSG